MKKDNDRKILTIPFVIVTIFISLIIFTAVFLAAVAPDLADDVPVLKDIVSTEPQMDTGLSEKSAYAYPTGGTAISSADAFKNAIRSGSSNTYYLSSNITWSNAGRDESTTFSGTIYGNGKTITITTGNTSETNTGDNRSIGMFCSVLKGTIRDCTIVVNDATYWHQYTGSSNNYTNYAGIICGKIVLRLKKRRPAEDSVDHRQSFLPVYVVLRFKASVCVTVNYAGVGSVRDVPRGPVALRNIGKLRVRPDTYERRRGNSRAQKQACDLLAGLIHG